MSMPFSRAFNIEHISERGCAYNIPGVTVDGNDIIAVYHAVKEAAARARAAEGPTLIESVTYRWRGHSKSDKQAYRTRTEVKEWQQRDPIHRFASMLGLSEAEWGAVQQEVADQIEQAVKFAETSPEPDVNTILEGVYA
jgi:pyruvate dehydrogenase E1 component alpha subunit